jgi:hypothetical protein
MERTSTDLDPVGGAIAKLIVDHLPAALLERLVLETTRDETPRQELAHRTADGIEVTLLWCECHDTIAVQVFDQGTDNLFEVVVAREHALDAFYHPYAYAAQQGLDYVLPALTAA